MASSPGQRIACSNSSSAHENSIAGTSVNPSRSNRRNSISSTSLRTGSCPVLKNVPLSYIGVEHRT